MKKITLLVTVLMFGFLVNAQPPEGNAEPGTKYGVAITPDGALAADELSPALKGKSTPVKVKGKVMEVCQAEGCWLKMATDNGPIMIRMKDHAFMVPVAINGKTIVATGIADLKETSVEMLKHYAEDAGKSKEEIAAITSPKKEIVLQATGILVL